ncbi:MULTISPECIES: type IV pilus secretin PilQ [unclassified Vibrio]|uniref:Type IV pilus secretin PilQ n=1 Tax=Vibrio sp. HB236076 TaxID=3232307 RepID=A0AB39HFP8_9VIBR|nr:type IV pilus secretin PilQ [Vibrio sp. HB161653]MDP5255763.1 type IV pilus secretin PilQ [Vibrio sp. HB161653]
MAKIKLTSWRVMSAFNANGGPLAWYRLASRGVGWAAWCVTLAALSVSVTTLAKAQTAPREPVLATAKVAEHANGAEQTSVHIERMAIADALYLLASQKGINLVVSEAVRGDTRLNVTSVPWQQAFDAILYRHQLQLDKQGEIWFVAPKPVQAEPTQMRTFALQHLSAAALLEQLQTSHPLSWLSEQGRVVTDSQNNALIIDDRRAELERIENLIAQLDVPAKQIEIEARLVTVTRGSLDEIGVRWGLSGDGVGASIEQNWQNQSYFDRQEGASLSEQLNVNLAASAAQAASVAMQVGRLGHGVLLDLELSALQQASKAEIISRPRLITTNQTTAYIEQGSEIPYVESAASGATSVAFKKAVLSLSVTPQVINGEWLRLDLNVTQDSQGETVPTSTGYAVAIDTRRLETQVLVESGQTIVLGGIVHQVDSEVTEQVPWLGDLPGVGALFRRQYQNQVSSELLIFVTPRLIPVSLTHGAS